MIKKERDRIRELKGREFFSFDRFLMGKMGENISEYEGKEIPFEVRNRAYRELLRRMGNQRVAAIQTLQKWFGIHGYTVPNRDTIIELGFSLGLSELEVGEYLKQGIGESDFQYNNYHEVIFMYCLHHQKSYEDALSMIQEYEENFTTDLEIRHHSETNEIAKDYATHYKLSWDEFCEWMKSRASDFKGYSKTVLEYFKVLKYEFLSEIKEEAKEKLNDYLLQTGYYKWEQTQKMSPNKRGKNVIKYLRMDSKKSKQNVSDDLRKVLVELSEMASINVNSNAELLRHLYDQWGERIRNYKTNNKDDDTKKRFAVNINLMNDKYLSNLLNIACNKEREIRLSLLARQLESLEDKMHCPDWAKEVIEEYDNECECRRVGDAKNWVKTKLKAQKRRCQQIHRSDILPLIHSVSLKRYCKTLGAKSDYRAEDAKKMFVKEANVILTACNMELLHPEKYVMDAILYACYQMEDYLYLSEILSELAE